MQECLRDRRLQWFGHEERLEKSAWSSKCRTFYVSCSFPRGRPREMWNQVIRYNLKEMKVSKNLAKDRNSWRSFIRNHPTHANIQNRSQIKYDDESAISYDNLKTNSQY